MSPSNPQSSDSIFSLGSTVFWFRRDLRLADNAGLYYALKENKRVIPLFIFDTEILQNLEDKADRRVDFIHQTLQHLKTQLEELGSSLVVLVGNPGELFEKNDAKSVYTNHDYEPYARNRDSIIENMLDHRGISLKTFKDHVIFERNEVVKDDGKPYSVFTPYSRKWKSQLTKSHVKTYPTERYFKNFQKS
ncbi:deoxyribodipyrimidine photo-lyase [Dolichospermum sp. ST_sed3]|nr:deoxyribodipyrimidine photo-lyase [Dolichospermum sp. ST_sed3]